MTPRQEINTVPSFIDAFALYGGSDKRLEWLRNGPVDGSMADNAATLMLPGGYLPLTSARGKFAGAPAMDLMGALTGHRANAVVAGDVRANENIALTATHTLFAREHNRIVSHLPASLSAEERFQIARRVVGAEQQYITYTQFLPALGVRLSPYRGYDPNVDPAITNEFATVGYRVHSMVHGEFEPTVPKGTYSPAQLKAFEREGVEIERKGQSVTLVIPLELAFGNPGLVRAVGLGPLLEGARRRAPVQERRADRRVDAQRPVPDPQARQSRPGQLRHADDQAGLLLRRPGPRRDRHRARARPRHPVLQQAPRSRTASPRRARTRPSPARRPRASRAAARSTAATRSTTRTSSTSRR